MDEEFKIKVVDKVEKHITNLRTVLGLLFLALLALLGCAIDIGSWAIGLPTTASCLGTFAALVNVGSEVDVEAEKRE